MADTRYNYGVLPIYFTDPGRKNQLGNDVVDIDADWELTYLDPAKVVRGTAASITLTLPPASKSKGRVIRCYSTVALGLALAAQPGDTLEPSLTEGVIGKIGENEYVDAFCTGTGWIRIGGNI